MSNEQASRTYRVSRGRDEYVLAADTFQEAMKKALPQLPLTDGYIWTVENAYDAETRRYRVSDDVATLIEVNGERVNSAEKVYPPSGNTGTRTATVQVMAKVEVPANSSVTDIQATVEAEDLEILDGGVNVIDLPHPEHEVFQE